MFIYLKFYIVGSIVVLLGDSRLAKEVIQNTEQTASIIIIGDPSTIDHLASDILQVTEGYRLRINGEQTLQLHTGHLKVRAVELIRQVPAKRAELLTLVYQSVNEPKTEQESLPMGAVLICVEHLTANVAARSKVLLEIVLQASR